MRRLALATLVVAVLAPSATAAPPAPLAPGVYPLIVIHGYDDTAYLLACSHVVRGKRPRLLSGTACAGLVGRSVKVELVTETGRVPVRLGKRGRGTACPGPSKRSFPTFAITGLPAEYPRRALIVGRGLARTTATPSAELGDAIRANNATPPYKSPHAPPFPDPFDQIDLDGDGRFELLEDDLGWIRVFGQDGKVIGEVGCAFA